MVWSKLGIDVTPDTNPRFQLIEAGCKRILKICKAEVEDQGKWTVRSSGKTVDVELQEKIKKNQHGPYIARILCNILRNKLFHQFLF